MRFNTVNGEKGMVNGKDDRENFPYLEAKVTTSGAADDDIICRSGKARATFDKLMNIWRSSQLSKNAKIKIFNVIDVLFYGCEAKPDTFQHKCLCRLLEIYWPNEEVRKRINMESISEQVRRTRRTWSGQMFRMDDSSALNWCRYLKENAREEVPERNGVRQ